MSLEEKFDAFMKSCQTIACSNQDLENQNGYFRRQIEETKKQTKKAVKSPSGLIREYDDESNNYISSSSHAKKPHRRLRGGRRPSTTFNDFKVEILECEGKLNPDEFIEWLNTNELIFEYKEIPDDKKVKTCSSQVKKICLFMVD